MTLQELMQSVFTRSYKGLEAQGFERAMIGDGCAYRGAHDTKCAVGQLITDDAYALTWNAGFDVSNLIALDADTFYEKIGVQRPDDDDHERALTDFLGDLQQCHDNNGVPHRMRWHLEHLACEHGLEVPE